MLSPSSRMVGGSCFGWTSLDSQLKYDLTGTTRQEHFVTNHHTEVTSDQRSWAMHSI